MNENIKSDRKFYLDTPDADFSPERNKSVIEDVIKKTDEYRKSQQRDHTEKVRERASAVATYLTTKRGGAQSGVSIESYLGKKTLAYLRGEQIINKLRSKKSLILS